MKTRIIAMLEEGGFSVADVADELCLDTSGDHDGGGDSDAVLLDGWTADDGNCAVEYPDAKSGLDAARDYVDGGSWGEEPNTTWVTIYVWRETASGKRVDEETHKIPIEPTEPECSDRAGHDWSCDHEVVGGLRENPGVWGDGGGIRWTEFCTRCGCGKHGGNWGQDPTDGEQGLAWVRYVVGEFTDEFDVE